ncbi:MAG: GNAT family N-acetyltransferase [Bacteroidota bacterium]
MIIDRLTKTDVEEYRTLMLGAYASEPETFTSTAEERAPLALEWWKSRVERDIVLGAYVSDRLVGVAGLRRGDRERTAHKATLFGMFVAPQSRRCGIGRALVEAVLDRARRSPPLRVVQLTVTKSNRSAVGLYEACGFSCFGSEPYAVRVDGGFVTKLHMWYDLANRAA